MSASVMRAFGPPSVLRVERDVPLPPPFGGADAAAAAASWSKAAKTPPANVPLALVQVAYCSVNPIDWKTRKGEVPKFAVTNPKVLGGDLAGTIVALSPAAAAAAASSSSQQEQPSRPFQVGDRVFSLTGLQEFWRPYGAYCEYASVPIDRLAHLPPSLSPRAAAAVPLAGMTAWQALTPAMPLRGKRVLVHAACGGVGCFAVQIAKAQGAAVVHGTCSARNADFLTKELGADGAIDYTKGPFEDDPLAAEEGYDVVVDLIGGDYERRSLALLRKRAERAREAWAREAESGGEPSIAPFCPRPYLAEVLNSGALREANGDQVKGALLLVANAAKGLAAAFFDRRAAPMYKLIVVTPKARDGLEQLAELIEKKQVRVFIEKEFASLEELPAAHELVEGGHVRGKVVVRVEQR
jgi:NADPH:quinone reductase-like Zn-dependent oxidoreductase